MKSRSRTYPILGALLALGAPSGHVLLRAALSAGAPTPSWLASELRLLAATYVYLSLSTTIVFAILGWILGRKEDRLQERAATDGLTGLANRRHFDGRLREEIRRAERYATPLSLLLVDVDNLKLLNARGGHEGGDEALRAVGETLARVVRRSDLAARIGGDEFAIITPMTHANDALELADRIRAALRDRRPGRFATPTVSIGVAEWGPSVPDPPALLATADKALYEAKERGRDRACLARS